MASLATTPLTAKEYAAQQTRRRRSMSRSVGRVVERRPSINTITSVDAETVPKVPSRRLQGFFSGEGGAVGVYIRVELDFNDSDPTGSPIHLWVWSSATECFDIGDISVKVGADNMLEFGPKLMKGMEGRVVSFHEEHIPNAIVGIHV